MIRVKIITDTSLENFEIELNKWLEQGYYIVNRGPRENKSGEIYYYAWLQKM